MTPLGPALSTASEQSGDGYLQMSSETESSKSATRFTGGGSMVESKEILHLEDDLNCQPVEEYMQAGLFCTRQLMVSTIAKQYHRLISGSFVPTME